jgi:NAD(P)-dependent dehydrogenase (short-subunit alcohol dehydrogenase family)
MGRLEGQSVVVTGAASGIGEATARCIVREGGRVVIADLQEERGAALADELGAAAAFCRTDVSIEDDIAAAVATAQRAFGGLDGMVNNAGIIGAVGSIMETRAEDFDHTMAILSRAVFLGIKHAGRAMRDKGRGAIVSMASSAGITGGLGPHVYTMAKHGVIGLTKSAATEMAPLGIRVNAIAPGNTVTDMTSALITNDPSDHATATKAIAAMSPLGVAGTPDDVANAVLFLLSDEARYVTGHTLVVDAGQTTGGAAMGFHGREADVLLHAGKRKSSS